MWKKGIWPALSSPAPDPDDAAPRLFALEFDAADEKEEGVAGEAAATVAPDPAAIDTLLLLSLCRNAIPRASVVMLVSQ